MLPRAEDGKPLACAISNIRNIGITSPIGFCPSLKRIRPDQPHDAGTARRTLHPCDAPPLVA
jgi:hypothetical protein